MVLFDDNLRVFDLGDVFGVALASQPFSYQTKNRTEEKKKKKKNAQEAPPTSETSHPQLSLLTAPEPDTHSP